MEGHWDGHSQNDLSFRLTLSPWVRDIEPRCGLVHIADEIKLDFVDTAARAAGRDPVAVARMFNTIGTIDDHCGAPPRYAAQSNGRSAGDWLPQLFSSSLTVGRYG